MLEQQSAKRADIEIVLALFAAISGSVEAVRTFVRTSCEKARADLEWRLAIHLS